MYWRHSTFLGAVLTACVVLSGCQQREEQPATGGGPMRADWGVVLPAQEQVKLPESCAQPSPSGLNGQWTPSKGDIDRLERRLATVINKALARVILEKGEALPRASDYYRQYGGLYRHGRRVVYVCGLHRWLLEATAKTAGRDTWMRTAMGADDGGLAGWEVQLESGLRGYLFAPDVEASR